MRTKLELQIVQSVAAGGGAALRTSELNHIRFQHSVDLAQLG